MRPVEEVETHIRARAEVWERAGLSMRTRVLCEAADGLEERRSEFTRYIMEDGSSRAVAAAIVSRALNLLRPERLEQYARWLVRTVKTEVTDELFVRRPDGVVLVLTAANGPLMNSVAVFYMMLAGNAVIVRTPGIRDSAVFFLLETILGDALGRNGFARGTVAVIAGRSRDMIATLGASPHVDTIVLFGNSTAGRALSEHGVRHNKKVVLELEGSDYIAVWKDADVEEAAASASSAWLFSTQVCVAPKHVVIHDAVFEPFVEAFVRRLPQHVTTMVADRDNGVLAPVKSIDGFFAALEEVRLVGKVHSGGYRTDPHGEPDAEGAYLAPTIVSLEDEAIGRKPLLCIDEEINFPLVPVIRFRGPDNEVLHRMSSFVRASSFGLRTSIWAADPAVLQHFTRELSGFGLLKLNEDHLAPPAFGSFWGGPKRSGGPFGENSMFAEKTSRLQVICCSRLTPEQRRAVEQAF